MEPNIEELKALIASKANARLSDERRALEFAIAAVEVLRDRGSISGVDLCRLAEFYGYDASGIASAWETRGEFDIGVTQYALESPIAKVRRIS